MGDKLTDLREALHHIFHIRETIAEHKLPAMVDSYCIHIEEYFCKEVLDSLKESEI